jgi:hypothetical protein
MANVSRRSAYDDTYIIFNLVDIQKKLTKLIKLIL